MNLGELTTIIQQSTREIQAFPVVSCGRRREAMSV